MCKESIVIGTRGSKLALWQAEYVAKQLKLYHPNLTIQLVKMKTSGDKFLHLPLANIGGKGLFTKELERALLSGDIDIAVHSLKDVPTTLPNGLGLLAMLKRGNPADIFVSEHYSNLIELPSQAIVGTSSLRRQAQILHIRPDLRILNIRGNVNTRLDALHAGRCTALILAAAGLERLNLNPPFTQPFAPKDFLPAVGQGILAVEGRLQDAKIQNLLKPLQDRETAICATAERAFLKAVDGSCRIPVAAHANIANNNIILEALIADIQGKKIVRDKLQATIDHAEILGQKLAEILLSRGGTKILSSLLA